jgi:hypothetical protein
VKKLLLLSIIMLSLFSCKDSPVSEDSEIFVITEESDEERPMFTVILPGGRVLEHYYAEEIAMGLIDGKWETNQDLIITETSEYQLFLEDSTVSVYSFSRKVASVPYNKIGVLDSIFIEDNK